MRIPTRQRAIRFRWLIHLVNGTAPLVLIVLCACGGGKKKGQQNPAVQALMHQYASACARALPNGVTGAANGNPVGTTVTTPGAPNPHATPPAVAATGQGAVAEADQLVKRVGDSCDYEPVPGHEQACSGYAALKSLICKFERLPSMPACQQAAQAAEQSVLPSDVPGATPAPVNLSSAPGIQDCAYAVRQLMMEWSSFAGGTLANTRQGCEIIEAHAEDIIDKFRQNSQIPMSTQVAIGVALVADSQTGECAAHGPCVVANIIQKKLCEVAPPTAVGATPANTAVPTPTPTANYAVPNATPTSGDTGLATGNLQWNTIPAGNPTASPGANPTLPRGLHTAEDPNMPGIQLVW